MTDLTPEDVALIQRAMPAEHRLASLLINSFPGHAKSLIDAARAEREPCLTGTSLSGDNQRLVRDVLHPTGRTTGEMTLDDLGRLLDAARAEGVAMTNDVIREHMPPSRGNPAREDDMAARRRRLDAPTPQAEPPTVQVRCICLPTSTYDCPRDMSRCMIDCDRR